MIYGQIVANLANAAVLYCKNANISLNNVTARRKNYQVSINIVVARID